MANPKWLDVALGEVGVHETKGKAATDRVEEYFAAAHSDVRSDETAWCSAFMNWVFAQSGYVPTYNLTARSWLKWGAKTKPVPGAVGVLPRGNSTWQGHVTMVIRVIGNVVECVGGNQSHSSGGAVTIVRYPISKFLGFRWPKTVRNSKTMITQAAGGVSGFAAFASETLSELQWVASDFSMYVDTIKYVAIAAAIGCFAFTAYLRWQKMKEPQE